MTESQPDNTAQTAADLEAMLDNGSNAHAAEVARLEAAIAAAHSRTAAARHRIAEVDSAARARLRDEVLATQTALAEMDRQHQAALAALRLATQAEIEQINLDRRATRGAN